MAPTAPFLFNKFDVFCGDKWLFSGNLVEPVESADQPSDFVDVKGQTAASVSKIKALSLLKANEKSTIPTDLAPFLHRLPDEYTLLPKVLISEPRPPTRNKSKAALQRGRTKRNRLPEMLGDTPNVTCPECSDDDNDEEGEKAINKDRLKRRKPVEDLVATLRMEADRAVADEDLGMQEKDPLGPTATQGRKKLDTIPDDDYNSIIGKAMAVARLEKHVVATNTLHVIDQYMGIEHWKKTGDDAQYENNQALFEEGELSEPNSAPDENPAPDETPVASQRKQKNPQSKRPRRRMLMVRMDLTAKYKHIANMRRAKDQHTACSSDEESAYIYESDGSNSNLDKKPAANKKTSPAERGELEDGDLCGVCKEPGQLLICDGCERAFHLQCIGLSTIPAGDWFCQDCAVQKGLTSETVSCVTGASATVPARTLNVDVEIVTTPADKKTTTIHQKTTDRKEGIVYANDRPTTFRQQLSAVPRTKVDLLQRYIETAQIMATPLRKSDDYDPSNEDEAYKAARASEEDWPDVIHMVSTYRTQRPNGDGQNSYGDILDVPEFHHVVHSEHQQKVLEEAYRTGKFKVVLHNDFSTFSAAHASGATRAHNRKHK